MMTLGIPISQLRSRKVLKLSQLRLSKRTQLKLSKRSQHNPRSLSNSSTNSLRLRLKMSILMMTMSFDQKIINNYKYILFYLDFKLKEFKI